MPRTYSFDHFTKNKQDVGRRLLNRDKQKLSAKSVRLAEPKIHYGKRFAGTEALAAAKTMNAELEELAGLPRKPEQTPLEKMSGPKVSLVEQIPIGALPVTEEPPGVPELFDLWDQAGRDLNALMSAL